MPSTIQLALPVSHFILTQGFGENPEVYKQFGRAGHNGIDLAVVCGTPVIAAADGRVVKIGNDPAGYGNYLRLDHGAFETLYAHLQDVQVKNGAFVIAGDVIAHSDNTGFSTGPHLHFELRIAENKSSDYPAGETDPENYFSDQLSVIPTGYATNAISDQFSKEESVEIPVTKTLQDPALHSGHSTQKTLYQSGRITATAGLNVHLQPKIESLVIGAIPYGQALPIIEADGDWVGILVWVHRDWIKKVDGGQ